jgi:hypothetical protein
MADGTQCHRLGRAHDGMPSGLQHEADDWTMRRRGPRPPIYGAKGCTGDRLRADQLEEAVFDGLVELYSDPQLLPDAPMKPIDLQSPIRASLMTNWRQSEPS